MPFKNMCGALLLCLTTVLYPYKISITNDSDKVVITPPPMPRSGTISSPTWGFKTVIHRISEDLNKGDSFVEHTHAAFCFNSKGLLYFQPKHMHSRDCKFRRFFDYWNSCTDWNVRIYDEGDTTKIDINGNVSNLHDGAECIGSLED